MLRNARLEGDLGNGERCAPSRVAGYDSWPHIEGFDYPVREDHDISAKHALHINHFWKLRYAYPNCR
jgi:hypothetical protein